MQYPPPPAWAPPQAPSYPPQGYAAQGYPAAPAAHPAPATYPAPAPEYAAAPIQSAPHGGGYEFGPAEEAVLRRNATLMNAFGVVSIVVGALGVIRALLTAHVLGIVVALPSTVVMILVGVYFVRGSKGLRSVITTKGDDVGHLMKAMDSVSTAFLVQLIAIAIAFVLTTLLGPFARM